MWQGRVILHVDMDAFFAAVEQMDNPSLRGKPVLVGHEGRRGVVAAASYEARKFGCHSAQPMAVARRMCPQAIVLPGRYERYHEISQGMFRIFDEFSPLVEPLSIDEAFLDLTGSQRLLGEPEAVARRLKERIKTELGLTASVGVAPNKFLAKLASDLRKPDGLVVIRTEDVEQILPPLPVTRLWGIGPATAERLRKVGIETIGDIRRRPMEELNRLLGSDAEWFMRLAKGEDDRPVTSDHEAKSIGQEQTFEYDATDREDVRRVMMDQVEQVGRRLRKQGLCARNVTLKIRYGDFKTITRSMTLKQSTNGTGELWKSASEVFDQWADKHFVPIRLIGVTAGNLDKGESQMSLFVDPQREKQKKVDEVADKIALRFGKTAIRRGGSMDKSGDG